MTTQEAQSANPSVLRRVAQNRLFRLLVLFFATALAYAGAQIFAAVVTPKVPAANRESFSVVTEGVSILLLLLVYWSLVRAMERRRVEEIAPARIPAIVPGALLGLGLFSATIGVLTVMGVAHVGGYAPDRPLLPAINMAALSAVGEELVFRGAVFRIVEEMFGSLAALVVSAAFFGLVHMGNHGATWTSGAAIALEAGLLLGACYMATRNLWLPIGLHFGWNFAEGGIFGSAVSGNPIKGLFETTMTGPVTLSGGAFGPEASIVAVGICAAAALVLLAVAIRGKQWKGLRVAFNDRSMATGE